MELFRCVHVFGDAAAKNVGSRFSGERRECVISGGLRRRGRGWKKCFGIGGEVGSAVGRVEAFGEYNEGGAGTGGFKDVSARTGKIDGFVGSWRGGRVGLGLSR